MRIVIFTDNGKLIVAMERISYYTTIVKQLSCQTFTGCESNYSTKVLLEYQYIAVLPADKIKTAEMIAEVVGNVLNCPISWGRE